MQQAKAARLGKAAKPEVKRRNPGPREAVRDQGLGCTGAGLLGPPPQPAPPLAPPRPRDLQPPPAHLLCGTTCRRPLGLQRPFTTVQLPRRFPPLAALEKAPQTLGPCCHLQGGPRVASPRRRSPRPPRGRRLLCQSPHPPLRGISHLEGLPAAPLAQALTAEVQDPAPQRGCSRTPPQ